LKVTEYFRYTRQRPGRAGILDEWIAQAMQHLRAETVQADGRIRRWVYTRQE
jgi:hypothetical protein